MRHFPHMAIPADVLADGIEWDADFTPQAITLRTTARASDCSARGRGNGHNQKFRGLKAIHKTDSESGFRKER